MIKNTAKLTAFVIAAGLITGCSTRNENSAQVGTELERDSVESVAPTSDGMPAGSSPSNAGSPPDSAALATDSTSRR